MKNEDEEKKDEKKESFADRFRKFIEAKEGKPGARPAYVAFGQMMVTPKDKYPILGTDSSSKPLIATAPQHKEILATAEQYSYALNISIINLFGESGVGKEEYARLIRDCRMNAKYKKAGEPANGNWKAGKFVAVSCTDFNGSAEGAHSRIFGHKKGAYTGATENRNGAVREAEGGTLFLDDLQNLPKDFVTHLYRFLDERREFTPLGSDKTETVKDILIITATQGNRLTLLEIFDTAFIERLGYSDIVIPPLNQRLQEIWGHLMSIIKEVSVVEAKSVFTYFPEDSPIIKFFESQDYTGGNVRRLREQAKAYLQSFPESSKWTMEKIKDRFQSNITTTEPITLDEAKKLHILKTWEKNNHSISQTAKVLKVEPETVKKYLKEMGKI